MRVLDSWIRPIKLRTETSDSFLIDMDIDIETGPGKVILSGSVISFGNNPIVLQFLKMKLILEFKDEFDENGLAKEEFDRKTEFIDQNTIKFKFTNYNKGSGIGTKEPFQFATLNEKSLFLSYLIYGSPTRQSKIVHYTIYQVDKNYQGVEIDGSSKNVPV
jgi:hypothetical protein